MTSLQTCNAIERHPDKLSGAWVFRSTRVPTSALFENFKDGALIEQFLEWFPGVDEASIQAVLEYEVGELANPVQS